jgi:hypothetical protein
MAASAASRALDPRIEAVLNALGKRRTGEPGTLPTVGTADALERVRALLSLSSLPRLSMEDCTWPSLPSVRRGEQQVRRARRRRDGTLTTAVFQGDPKAVFSHASSGMFIDYREKPSDCVAQVRRSAAWGFAPSLWAELAPDWDASDLTLVATEPESKTQEFVMNCSTALWDLALALTVHPCSGSDREELCRCLTVARALFVQCSPFVSSSCAAACCSIAVLISNPDRPFEGAEEDLLRELFSKDTRDSAIRSQRDDGFRRALVDGEILHTLREVMPRSARVSPVVPHVAALVASEFAFGGGDDDVDALVLLDLVAFLSRIGDSHRPWMRYMALSALTSVLSHPDAPVARAGSLLWELHRRIVPGDDASLIVLSASVHALLCIRLDRHPPSAEFDSSLERTVRLLALAGSPPHQRASLVAVLVSLTVNGTDAARFISVALPALASLAVDSTDVECVSLALQCLRCLAFNCWPRVVEDEEFALHLVRIALLVSAQSLAMVQDTEFLIDDEAEGDLTVLNPGNVIVLEQALMVLAVVGRALGGDTLRHHLRAILSHSVRPNAATSWVLAFFGLEARP